MIAKKKGSQEFASLRIQYLALVARLLFAGICLIAVLIALSETIVLNTYGSAQNEQRRLDQAAQSFIAYVQEGKLASTDQEEFTVWAERHQSLTMILVSDNQLVYEARYGRIPKTPAASFMPVYQQKSYEVHFSDKTCALFLKDSSTRRIQIFCRIASILSGIILMMAMVLRFTGQKIRMLEMLTAEVEEVKNGHLSQPIELGGNDEISLLARHIEELRQALVTQTADEKKAWDKNYELLTAVSHDIRTPLTALLGYLTLLGENPKEAPEQYVQAAYQKALQLKDLTDGLFRYFLVYGKKELTLEFMDFPVSVVLGEMLAERIVYLGSLGFQVRTIGLDQQEGIVKLDAGYLMRIFDNLFSNIQKYADNHYPVVLIANAHDNQLQLIFDNVIATARTGTESTGIGMKTCEKIATMLGGRLESGVTGNHFQVELDFPLQTEDVTPADGKENEL